MMPDLQGVAGGFSLKPAGKQQIIEPQKGDFFLVDRDLQTGNPEGFFLSGQNLFQEPFKIFGVGNAKIACGGHRRRVDSKNGRLFHKVGRRQHRAIPPHRNNQIGFDLFFELDPVDQCIADVPFLKPLWLL